MFLQRLPHCALLLLAVMELSAITPVSASAHTQRPASYVAVTAGKPLREVFGFALSGTLADPSVGYPSWNFSMLSTVAFFGIHVNWNGTLVADSDWSVWNSTALTGLLATAHARGTKVVLTIVLQDFQPGTPNMCAGLINRATTVSQAVAQVAAKGVDGLNVDYEGLNGTCQNGQTARAMMTDFVARLRGALPSGSYLSVDTYASSASDPLGFFDVAALSQYADAFFVMAYDLEYSNYHYSPPGCARFCLGPTAPLTGYHYNDTTTAGEYVAAVPASKVILGVPYYGRKSCVGAAVPNAYPNSSVTADRYLDASTESTDPAVQGGTYASHRDANDTGGAERWDTWFNTSLGCTRELYWDDPVSLGKKYDLVNQDGLRGVGIWTLNYGGGAAELWSTLSSRFASCRSVSVSTSPSGTAGAGTAVAISAKASGCPNPLYHIAVMAPGAGVYKTLQDYTATSTYTWNTSGLVPGAYRISVWARDAASAGASGNAAGRWDTYNNDIVYTLTGCSTTLSVSVAPASPATAGTVVNVSARSAGCPHPNPLFHFSVMAPGASAYTLARDYSTSNTYAWNTTGLVPGTYRFSVWVRDSGSGGAFGNAAGRWDAYDNATTYSLTGCASVTVTTSPGPPAPSGSSVGITAHASGCANPLFHFGIMAPGSSTYVVAQDYSSKATYNWSTAGFAPGAYRLSVWVRDSASAGALGNSAGRWDAYDNSTLYALTPVCSAVAVTVSPASPATRGTKITVTAHASGCPNPVYHFSIMAPGATAYQVVQVYSGNATFVWTTTGLASGSYRFSVWARDASSPGLNGNAAGRWDAYNNDTVYSLT